MKFYLGLHHPSDSEKIDVPYMVSVRSVLKRKKPLFGDWLMDSGGFTELSLNGKYTILEDDYVDCIRRLNPSGAFAQDWMCEPIILKKTGLTIWEHQVNTTVSYLSMRERTDKVIPVLQGFRVEDYLHHIASYQIAGVSTNQLFGLGSVCKRQRTNEIIWIITTIKQRYPEIKLHGFGVKTTALKNRLVTESLYSADSLAWAITGNRDNKKYCDPCNKKTHSNCINYALMWRDKVLNERDKSMEYPVQDVLAL